ncbi:hypothetical protein Q75_16680 [Bacillus coahuilensis p1.1.43]|uniref:DUF1761 domain-containing protein n=1 Tax=Bacillus coahuilensis p1.1.43 TaxID=1150625 RepID=A0A147K437_9BACI|nr:DUF1761 domain-containing protein [Bacillus coahuilensis]KUP04054.1 hypothetical protein Q75_16680 [Bacillus coahuilensis p1.1.43]
MFIDFLELNYLAILAGAFAYMIFGAVYYSPLLFGDVWMQLHQKQASDPVKYAGSAIVAIVSSFFIAILIQLTGAATFSEGITVGLIIGVFVTVSYAKNMLFGMTSRKVFGIAIADHIIIYSILGILHALWQ